MKISVDPDFLTTTTGDPQPALPESQEQTDATAAPAAVQSQGENVFFDAAIHTLSLFPVVVDILLHACYAVKLSHVEFES